MIIDHLIKIGVGKAIKDTVVNTVETVKGGVKAVGKLVKGDTKGALKEVKATPLFKEGENLVKSVKQVGEGIVKGDLKKVGDGLLGVATNDLLGFIPGQKALGIGAKAVKSGIKNVVEKTAKKDVAKKPAKDDIVDKSFKDKKSEEKAKEDKKKKECNAKKTRKRRATDGKKDDDCDKKDVFCNDVPSITAKSESKILKPSLTKCKGMKADSKSADDRCFYLCNAGFEEKPESLLCKEVNGKGEWDGTAGCEPQPCGTDGFIRVESSTLGSVLDKTRGYKSIFLYLVKYDSVKRLPIYSMTYYKFSLSLAKFSNRKNKDEGDDFRQHPCLTLRGKQAASNWYTGSGKCCIIHLFFHNLQVKLTSLF